jgi:hypothetical protein
MKELSGLRGKRFRHRFDDEVFVFVVDPLVCDNWTYGFFGGALLRRMAAPCYARHHRGTGMYVIRHRSEVSPADFLL